MNYDKYYCLHFDQKQAEFVELIKTKKKLGLFLGMGSGKTITTLTAISDLFRTGKIKNVLVIAPLKIANFVWKQEAAEWDHTCHLKVQICTGDEKNRLENLNAEADIHVINHEQTKWLIDNYIKNWPWDVLIIDESSTFKSYKSKKFKALRRISYIFDYIVLLSGTPSPQNYLDLWPQLFLLDRGKRLGRNITLFKQKYFYESGYNGYVLKLFKNSEKEIKEKISDICYTYSRPSQNGSIYIKRYIDFPPAVAKSYDKFKKDFVLELQNENNILSPSLSTLGNKLLQICNGCIYDENKKAHTIHNEKIKELKNIMDDNPAENYLVIYNFKHDLESLIKSFPEARTITSLHDIDEWNRGNIKMLLLHPKSGGHGLNLQYGGSVIIWYGLTWSLELYQQTNKRLDRPGQKNTVRIIHILAKDRMCDIVYDALNSKAKTQQDLIDYLKYKFK
jgi:SNF2 family DNA or RNA helicase